MRRSMRCAPRRRAGDDDRQVGVAGEISVAIGVRACPVQSTRPQDLVAEARLGPAKAPASGFTAVGLPSLQKMPLCLGYVAAPVLSSDRQVTRFADKGSPIFLCRGRSVNNVSDLAMAHNRIVLRADARRPRCRSGRSWDRLASTVRSSFPKATTTAYRCVRHFPNPFVRPQTGRSLAFQVFAYTFANERMKATQR
jgi:hypothetical protein